MSTTPVAGYSKLYLGAREEKVQQSALYRNTALEEVR